MFRTLNFEICYWVILGQSQALKAGASPEKLWFLEVQYRYFQHSESEALGKFEELGFQSQNIYLFLYWQIKKVFTTQIFYVIF